MTTGNQRKNADALSFPRRSIGTTRRFHNSGKLMTGNQRMTMRPRPINARDIRPANSGSLHTDKLNIPEPGNRESGETETAIPVKRKP